MNTGQTHGTEKPGLWKFGQVHVNALRRLPPRPGDTWHPDGVFLTTQGERRYLWRAFDQDGKILDIFVQR